MKSWQEFCAQPARHKVRQGGEIYRFINEADYNDIQQDVIASPVPELKGKIPVVIYLSNEADVQEFKLAFLQAKPDAEVRKL